MFIFRVTERPFRDTVCAFRDTEWPFRDTERRFILYFYIHKSVIFQLSISEIHFCVKVFFIISLTFALRKTLVKGL